MVVLQFSQDQIPPLPRKLLGVRGSVEIPYCMFCFDASIIDDNYMCELILLVIWNDNVHKGDAECRFGIAVFRCSILLLVAVLVDVPLVKYLVQYVQILKRTSQVVL